MPEPVRLVRTEEHASFGGHRLRRILGYEPRLPLPISALVDDPGYRPTAVRHVMSYLDATSQTPIWTSEGTTALHILWTAHDPRHVILAGVDPVSECDLIEHEVHPGDTLLIPGDVPYAVGAGIVAFVFGSAPATPAPAPEAWSHRVPPHPPTHGLNLFDRFNRRTLCAATTGLLLERWKISHPLDLRLNPDHWHYLTNLVDPVALSWAGGSDLLQRTESRFLARGMDRIAIVPDGLGYVLVASVPELTADVVVPLRQAGYDRSAIASLGVPAQALLDKGLELDGGDTAGPDFMLS